MATQEDRNESKKEHTEIKRVISRRKALAAIGAAGVAIAATGLLNQGGQDVGKAETGENNDRVGEGGTRVPHNSSSMFSFGPFANVMQFGAAGDGVADDTQAIRDALESLSQGGTLYFPIGTYKVTSRISVHPDSITLTGQGRASKLVYVYEQKETDSTATASLFVFRPGIRDVTVRDLQLEYTGSFFPNFGESYKGKVSGLKFRLCSDVQIENIEVSGFNASGIEVATGSSNMYAKRFKVHQCYCHHNRVAGVLFGNVEYISITDCDLDYNGSEPDGGTGYGCAGSSGEWPKHIQLIGNRASYNYRKGLDLHAGTDALIEGNVCHGNRLYGIYAEGRKTGNVVIKGNIISGMRRATIGIPEPYTWITGIAFGPYSDSLVTDDFHHYIIEGNLFTDFGIDLEGNAYPIQCYYNFNKGSVQIRNNVIRAGRISYMIVFSPKAPGVRDTKVDISGNQAIIEETTIYTMWVPQCGQLNIQGNQIGTNQTANHDGVIVTDNASLKSLTYIGNHITDPGIIVSSALKGYEEDWLKSKTVHIGNFLNDSVEK